MSDPEDKTRTLPVRARCRRTEGGDVAALAPGQTVLEYRIDKMLGGGGFGITYLAQDVNLQLPVAIKEYFPGDLAVRAADLSVQRRGPATTRRSSSGAWSASSTRRARWRRFAIPTSCGCCATSRKTARPTS